jgi:hypothetical protein
VALGAGVGASVAARVGAGVSVGSGVEVGIPDVVGRSEVVGRLEAVGRTVGVGTMVEPQAVNVTASSTEAICVDLPATPPFWRRGARAVNVARRVTG